MSQRQQQHSAVQHAVRQALSPVSSLRRSSTTYTAGTERLVRHRTSAQNIGTVTTPRTSAGPAPGAALQDVPAHPSCRHIWLALLSPPE